MSDGDPQMREIAIHLNPGQQETAALLNRSMKGEVRGVMWNDGAYRGFVAIWDAYLANHDGASDLLAEHGYEYPYGPRFAMSKAHFQAGHIAVYGGLDDRHHRMGSVAATAYHPDARQAAHLRPGRKPMIHAEQLNNENSSSCEMTYCFPSSP